MIYNETVKDNLVLVQVVRPNFFIENVVDKLIFSETNRQNQFIESIQQILFWDERVDKRDSIETLTVSQSLNLIDSNARLVTDTDVIDILIFTQSICPTAEQVLQSLTFQEDIVHDHAQTIADILEFSETITEWLVSTETVSDTLTFVDSAVDYSEAFAKCQAHSYSYRGYIELEFNGIIVRLRTPDFGNSDSTSTAKVINQLRSGQHKISKNGVTPDLVKHTITVSYNKESDFISLRNFLRISMGKEVTYRDYENGERTVIILNPETAFVQEDINNRTVTLEMVE